MDYKNKTRCSTVDYNFPLIFEVTKRVESDILLFRKKYVS